MKNNLVIISASFPYPDASEDSFICPEIPELAINFNLYFLPISSSGLEACQCCKQMYTLIKRRSPSSVRERLVKVKQILFSSLELLMHELKHGPRLRTLSDCRRLLKEVGIASSFAYDLDLSLRTYGISSGTVLTYWFDSYTAGSAYALRSHSEFAVMSKTHGIDLYEDRHANNTIPLRLFTLKYLRTVFCISHHGLNYLNTRYPAYHKIFLYAPMGIIAPEPEVVPRASSPVFNICSCSSLIDVKNVELMIFIIEQVSKMTDRNITWHHIGTGPLKANLEKLAESRLSLISFDFVGPLNNSQVHSFYRSHNISLFLNTSLFEGRPFAVMEALGYSIPVCAPNVGGLSELVIDRYNGILYDPSSKAEYIAERILELVDNPMLLKQCSLNSLDVYHKTCRSDICSRRLAHLIQSNHSE